VGEDKHQRVSLSDPACPEYGPFHLQLIASDRCGYACASHESKEVPIIQKVTMDKADKWSSWSERL